MQSFSDERRKPYSMDLLLLAVAYYHILLANGQQVGVSLQLHREIVPNNSLFNFDDLLYRTTSSPHPTNANGLQTLMCVTNLVACCETQGLGNWYLPDGRTVDLNSRGIAAFQRNRGQNEVVNGQQFYGSVRLWRRFNAAARGLFRCELPDANNVIQTLYVNILYFTPIAGALSVAISPSGSTTAGETYSLICSATLQSQNSPSPESYITPSPTYEWFFGPNGNFSLPSGMTPTATVLNSSTYTSTLQFSPLSQSHTGNYTCRLGAGSLVNSAVVTVNVPAISVQITTSGALMLGKSDYSLTCGVGGAANLNPSITYQWTKNNGTQTQLQVRPDPKILSFSPFRLSDAGRYTCQATVSSPYLNNDITMMDSHDVTLQTPSRPRNIVAVNEAVIKILLNWTVPATPNGIITGYRVTIDGVGETVVVGMKFLSGELSPNTVYTYRILAINGHGDGEVSPDMTFTTSFGVVQPVITSTAVGNAGAPRFTINTERFSSHYGGLGIYKVVVIHGSRVDPADIPDSQLAPAATSQFNYYVAYIGDARRQLRSTFVVGDDILTTDGITIFTNPPPMTGENYYVFIRLYSSINSSIYADSQLTGMLRFEVGTPQDIGAILGPVISFLIITLSLALVFGVVYFVIKKRRKDQKYADVTNGAGAKENYENATEMDFMRAGASSKSNRFTPEYEVPDNIIAVSQNPEQLYEEIEQPPAAEKSDWIELNVCPAYGMARKL